MIKNTNYILLFLFLLLLMLYIILYNVTYFDKNIVIKNKYTRFTYTYKFKYMVVDKDNNTYSVDNLWWKGDFNRVDNWNLLQNGMEYRVKGYGIEFPMLDYYPIIISVSKK
jgi:hypothetical protein